MRIPPGWCERGAAQRTREERRRERGANFGAGDSKTASKLRKRDKSKEGRSRTELNPNYDDPEAR